MKKQSIVKKCEARNAQVTDYEVWSKPKDMILEPGQESFIALVVQ